MKKILVTGASGFIGRHTLNKLNDFGYEVYAISKQSKIYAECHWSNIDLFHFENVNNLIKTIRPTYLLHFGWSVSPDDYWTSLDNFKWVNASMNLIQTFHKYGGERIVAAGSCAEYDWKYGYLCENVTPLSYTSPYSVSKNSLQQLISSYATTVGISFAWGRIFWLYGPNEDERRLIPSLVKTLIQEKEFICRNGESIRDFLHVSDVADAFVHLLLSPVEGTINVASGQPTKIKDIINHVAEQLGKLHLIKYISSIDETPLVLANISRLKKDLEWQPKVDLEEGINITIEYWKTILGG